MLRIALRVLLLTLIVPLWACQSPTNPSDTTRFDQAVDVSFSPNPVAAEPSAGKTYRVPRNNEPDEIREYDWHGTFALAVSLNGKATEKDVDLKFPVRLTAATLTVKQASGGIVTPPTGGETERYEFVTLQATGNQFAGVNSPISLTFEVWYDLPSLRREALITVSLTFIDNESFSFTKTADVTVAP